MMGIRLRCNKSTRMFTWHATCAKRRSSQTLCGFYHRQGCSKRTVWQCRGRLAKFFYSSDVWLNRPMNSRKRKLMGRGIQKDLQISTKSTASNVSSFMYSSGVLAGGAGGVRAPLRKGFGGRQSSINILWGARYLAGNAIDMPSFVCHSTIIYKSTMPNQRRKQGWPCILPETVR